VNEQPFWLDCVSIAAFVLQAQCILWLTKPTQPAVLQG